MEIHLWAGKCKDQFTNVLYMQRKNWQPEDKCQDFVLPRPADFQLNKF